MTAMNAQRGAALLVTLVLVALISLLAFGVSQTTRMQQQLATNEAARQIAFQAAEAALRAAEQSIADADDLSLFCNEGGSSRYAITERQDLENDSHWERLSTDGEPVDFSLYSSGVGALILKPRYLVGCIDASLVESYLEPWSAATGKSVVISTPRYFFRVFSVGFSPDGMGRVTLEARYVY